MVLKTSGYPGPFVCSASTPCPGHREEEEAPTAAVINPYIMGVSEDIMRACRPYNIRVAFTSERNIRLLFSQG